MIAPMFCYAVGVDGAGVLGVDAGGDEGRVLGVHAHAWYLMHV
jgi:hypothetical protein